jgi:hypothetical protein
VMPLDEGIADSVAGGSLCQMPQISRSQTPGPREGANAIEPR